MKRLNSHAAVGVTIALTLTNLLLACRRQLSLDEVIAQHTAAMGGRTAIESVSSIQFQLHIVDPGFEVDGTYRAMRPGRMRIDVVAGGKHIFTEAFDGKRGWQWSGAGDPVGANAQATAALRHGVELPGKLFGLHELKQRGHHVELAGRERINRVGYYSLKVTLNDGYATSLYIDPETWRITRRRDVRPLHVDIDPRPTTIETVFSDFRQVSGLWFPFASTDSDLATGKTLETTQVNSVVINPALGAAIFEKL
jgi:hypothetical protein